MGLLIVVPNFFYTFAPSNNKTTTIMETTIKQTLIEDAMVVMSGDMFQKIYNLGDLGWVYVTHTIKSWAREFIEQLNWKGADDDRDWLIELENFEEKKFEQLKKNF